MHRRSEGAYRIGDGRKLGYRFKDLRHRDAQAGEDQRGRDDADESAQARMPVMQSGTAPFRGCGIWGQLQFAAACRHIVAALESEAVGSDFDVAAWDWEARGHLRVRVQRSIHIEAGPDHAISHVAAVADINRVGGCCPIGRG